MKLSVPIFQSLMLVLLVVTISGLKKHSKHKTYLIETVDDDVNSVEGLNPRQIGGAEGAGDYCMPFSMWCGR